jgi:hypothetical protein
MRKHRGPWVVLVSCLALAVATCNEVRRSRDADEDEERPPATVPQRQAIVLVKALADNFGSDTADQPPAGFSFPRTGQGSEGNWLVKEDLTAFSKPNVMAQTSTDTTDDRFPLAILDQGSYQDVAVSVKFQAVAGKVDQAAGIVFRYRARKLLRCARQRSQG